MGEVGNKDSWERNKVFAKLLQYVSPLLHCTSSGKNDPCSIGSKTVDLGKKNQTADDRSQTGLSKWSKISFEEHERTLNVRHSHSSLKLPKGITNPELRR